MRRSADRVEVPLRRERKVPNRQHESRLCVLNALRTIVPHHGELRLLGLRVPIVLYDFFYCGSELHLLVCIGSLVHDVASLYKDLAHVALQNMGLIPGADAGGDAGYWWTLPAWKSVYIRCKHSGAFLCLDDALPKSAKHHKFSPSLQNWIAGSRSLDRFHVPEPFGHQPLTSDLRSRLGAPVRYPKAPCGGCGCPVLRQETSLADLASAFPSTIHHTVQDHARVGRLEEKFTRPVLEHRTSERPQCAADRDCAEPFLTCFWLKCCKSQRPIVCQAHASEIVHASLSKHTKCPVHGVLGPVVQTIENVR
jgi:hypothetical protein